MFKGTSHLSLDDKGRLTMPTKHRGLLHAISANGVTITRHQDGCLLVFPEPAWKTFYEKISSLGSQYAWHKRLYLASAEDVGVDSTGRFLIPPELRGAVGLKKNVALMAMGEHFELWDRETYESKSDAGREKEREHGLSELPI